MAFVFTQRSDVRGQVRELASGQIDAALEACRNDADFDKTVHGLRRRCKKLRGLLRLVEPGFAGFDRENHALRHAANSLAGTRDAAVMRETFDGLVQFDCDGDREQGMAGELADAVKARLEQRLGSRPDAAEQRRLLTDFAHIAEQVGQRAKRWKIERHGFAALKQGLDLTYRRMVEAMDAAMADEKAAELHEWRKHAKYHWHHVSLFAHAAPDLLGRHRDLLDTLGELLGDHHNLHVLRQSLAAQPEPLGATDLDAVAAVITRRQSQLAARAFALGRQLTAEKPGALRRRFGHLWQLLPQKAG